MQSSNYIKAHRAILREAAMPIQSRGDDEMIDKYGVTTHVVSADCLFLSSRFCMDGVFFLMICVDFSSTIAACHPIFNCGEKPTTRSISSASRISAKVCIASAGISGPLALFAGRRGGGLRDDL